MIGYSVHAEKRMRERGITKEEIGESLARPLETREMRYGRQGVCRHLTGDSFLVVIVEKRGEEDLTALKVNSDRVRRYGITRV